MQDEAGRNRAFIWHSQGMVNAKLTIADSVVLKIL
jgi:hypothetical protein